MTPDRASSSGGRRTRTGVVLLLVVAGGCVIGGQPDVAGSPTGVETEVRLTGGASLTGELLEVRDDGLLLLSHDRVTLVRWPALLVARFPRGFDVRRVQGSPPPSLAERETLLHFSRYPFGLTEVQLARLLRSTGQDELRVIG